MREGVMHVVISLEADSLTRTLKTTRTKTGTSTAAATRLRGVGAGLHLGSGAKEELWWLHASGFTPENDEDDKDFAPAAGATGGLGREFGRRGDAGGIRRVRDARHDVYALRIGAWRHGGEYLSFRTSFQLTAPH